MSADLLRPSSRGCSGNRRRSRRRGCRSRGWTGRCRPPRRAGSPRRQPVSSGRRRGSTPGPTRPSRRGCRGSGDATPRPDRLSPSPRRSVACLRASGRHHVPRPRRSAREVCRRTPCRRHRGSAAVRRAPEKTSAATTRRGLSVRGGPWIASIIATPRIDIRRYNSSMSSTRGVRWLMCVVVTPAMSAATADTRLNSSYHPRSIGSRDSANAATAAATNRAARSRSAPPSDAMRRASAIRRGVEQLPTCQEPLDPSHAVRGRRIGRRRWPAST